MADLFITFIDLFLHLDKHLADMLQYFGVWTYVVIFLIIFCETGLVVTPILPGDSLLFGLGAFAANTYLKGPLEVEWLFFTLSIAAIAGDSVNYAIGHCIGPRVFYDGKYRFMKREYLERTRCFYERHGGKTIVIARFIPIIRTFAPFVAGIGKMRYARFFLYNIIGSVAWVSLFLSGGFFFGGMPFVQRNFSLVVLAIICISFIPPLIAAVRIRLNARK